MFGRLRSAVFGTPHRVSRHKTAPTRMLRNDLAQLLFGRPHIDYHLFLVNQIQGFDGQHRDRIDRCCQHNQIGIFDRLVQLFETIHQFQFECLVAIIFRVIHPDHLLGNSFFFQGQCKRSSDQPHTDNGNSFNLFILFHDLTGATLLLLYYYLFNKAAILSLARNNTSTGEQRLIRI